MRGFVILMRRPWLYRAVGRLGRWLHWVSRPIHGTPLDPFRAWKKTRDLDAPAAQSFKEYWSSREDRDG